MPSTITTTLLGLCGSLRQRSINATLLRALSTIAPPGVAVAIHEGLGELPLFNPDRESDPPAAVRAYWSALERCDGVIIASPEYAHGYTAVIKNALDWAVGRGSFMNKPVAVLNTAPRSRVAATTLKEVLRTIDACLLEEASLDIPILGRGLSESGLVGDVEIRPRMETVLATLLRQIRSGYAVDRPQV
jgi:NAD(P)H-dependent FMN reductase